MTRKRRASLKETKKLLKEIKKLLLKRTRMKHDIIYLTSAVPMLLEVSDSHGGKASGLAFLEDYLDIARPETAAFGNAENDSDMIAWAGWGVAVANSPEHVRLLADEVTESNDEDGVGRWIQRYLQRKGRISFDSSFNRQI